MTESTKAQTKIMAKQPDKRKKSLPIIDTAKAANRDRVRAWRSRNVDKQQVALYLSKSTYQLIKDAAHREAFNLSTIAERELRSGLLRNKQSSYMQPSITTPKGGELIIGTIWARKKQAKPWEAALTEVVSTIEEFAGCLDFNRDTDPLSQGIMQDVPTEIWDAIRLIYDWSRG